MKATSKGARASSATKKNEGDRRYELAKELEAAVEEIAYAYRMADLRYMAGGGLTIHIEDALLRYRLVAQAYVEAGYAD